MTERLDGAALRERRRQRTAREIERVALRLFAQKGYHHVTVEEIAAAAEISERTFFRYFASKDEVLAAEERRRMDALCELVAARDASEPAWLALHNAITELLTRLEQDEEAMVWARVTADESNLRAGLVIHANEISATVVAGLLAERMPPDRADDLELQVMMQSMMGAAVVAYRTWLTDPTRPLVTLAEAALAMVEEGLAHHRPATP